MPDDRRARILLRLVGDGSTDVRTNRLCTVCAEVTEMTGAGVMLMSGDVSRGWVCTTDSVSKRIEELQYELGEGPCIDAFNEDRPIYEPDLAHPSTPRWLAFSGPALEAGARAVFGFPLRVGAARLGALNLYNASPGAMSDEQHADALVAADVTAQALLVLQSGAPLGQLAAALEGGADFQYVVHQASGMVAVQLGVSVGTALVRLRAHAFGNDRSLADVARDVVARTMRFDATGGENDGSR